MGYMEQAGMGYSPVYDLSRYGVQANTRDSLVLDSSVRGTRKGQESIEYIPI